MQCYLCKGQNLEVVRTKLRHNVERKAMQCNDCGLNFLEPKPSPETKDLHEYYGKEYRKKHSPVIGQALTSQETFDIYAPYQEARVKRLGNILKKDMRVLEIGCSSGHFLHTIKKYVGEVIGLEYNLNDAEFVRTKLGFRVYTEPVEKTDLPQDYFDLICAFQIFEHVEDPLQFLNNLKPYLKTDGYLCIEVPNVDEALLTVYRSQEYADFWYREPHLFNYSPKTLKAMLAKAGFEGDIKTIQRINFLNHMNWIFTGKPQSGADIHMAPPVLARFDTNPPQIKEDFNAWVQRINDEYCDLVNKHGLGESVLFIGKKIK